MVQFINIAHPEQGVSFPQAVVTGLGKGQGLFFPERIEPLGDVQGLLEMGFVRRSAIILQHLVGESMAVDTLEGCVERAFNFPLALESVSAGVHALELFHGNLGPAPLCNIHKRKISLANLLLDVEIVEIDHAPVLGRFEGLLAPTLRRSAVLPRRRGRP